MVYQIYTVHMLQLFKKTKGGGAHWPEVWFQFFILPCACFFIFPCSLPFAFYGKWCFLSSTDLKVMSIFVLQVISSIKKYIWGKKRLNASLWDAKAGTSWMIRLPSQVPRPYWLAVYMLICCGFFFFFFLKPCINVSLLFWQDINCAETMLPQSNFSE